MATLSKFLNDLTTPNYDVTLWRWICVQKRSLFHQEDHLISRIFHSEVKYWPVTYYASQVQNVIPQVTEVIHELCKSRYIGFGTLGPAYNKFGYYEHPPTMSRFLCIKTIDSNVKKVWLLRAPLYNEQFSLHLFARYKRDPV